MEGSGIRSFGSNPKEVVANLQREAASISTRLRHTIEFAKKLGRDAPKYKEAAEYYIARGFWLSWRRMGILAGLSLDYRTPLEGRVISFGEFMREWIGVQFKRQLADYGIELPWFWRYWEEETNWFHHAIALILYLSRRMQNSHVRGPTPDERRWFNEKYPGWDEMFGRYWDLIANNWIEGKIPQSLVGYLSCNVCGTSIVGKPGRPPLYQKELGGRVYHFCSPVCMWIFEEEIERWRGYLTFTDRLLVTRQVIKFREEHLRDPRLLANEVLWASGITEAGEAGVDPTNGAWALLYKEKDPEFEKRKAIWMS